MRVPSSETKDKIKDEVGIVTVVVVVVVVVDDDNDDDDAVPSLFMDILIVSFLI